MPGLYAAGAVSLAWGHLIEHGGGSPTPWCSAGSPGRRRRPGPRCPRLIGGGQMTGPGPRVAACGPRVAALTGQVLCTDGGLVMR